jgi:hypothetical protein
MVQDEDAEKELHTKIHAARMAIMMAVEQLAERASNERSSPTEAATLLDAATRAFAVIAKPVDAGFPSA